MKWSYLRRAYAIKEYAYLRANEAANRETCRSEELANSLTEVLSDLHDIYEMAQDSLECDYQYNYRTIRQCEKFFKDFGG